MAKPFLCNKAIFTPMDYLDALAHACQSWSGRSVHRLTCARAEPTNTFTQNETVKLFRLRLSTL